jgi:hypothetical protein
MSSEIQFRDATAPTDPDASLLSRFENTINTPIVSISWLDNGEAIAGDYTIAATGASTVNVTPEDPKNEHAGTGITVVADGATVNKGTLPGVGIVFSASLASGWTAKVSVGAFMDSGGSTSRRFNVGTVEADAMSTQRRIAARNVGSEDSSETAVYALPGFYVGGSDVWDWLKLVKNHTDPARHALATPGDYVITFQDWQDLAADTVDVYVNKDGGGANKAIEDAVMDETLYEYGVSGYIDGGDYLPGMGIALYGNGDPTSKTFTIYVREGDDWVEFAPDSSGSPGTWQSGPLTLTELGETSGTITASGHAFFWVRVNIPSSASPGDMRFSWLRSRGLTV